LIVVESTELFYLNITDWSVMFISKHLYDHLWS
jgi:hypothetical protein